MITREEAKAWLDRIADARLAYAEPLRYGDYKWECVETYEPFYEDRVPVHKLKVLIEALGLPVRRVYSPCKTQDEIHMEYRGLLFTDYIYPKRIGKKAED